MSDLYLDAADGDIIPLPAADGLPAAVHVIDDDSILAVNAALATGRPLLVRGEPGTGKSQLARAAAVRLGRALLTHAVDGRTETRDLLWSVDAVARLAEAQIMGTLRDVTHEQVKKRIAITEFVQPGPLWWAFDWLSAQEQARRSGMSEPITPVKWTPAQGAVVLVDEIDKADVAIPNGLLDALGHGRFDVPGRLAVTQDRACPPLVIITTNEERALPDAFLRRCLVLHLALPDENAILIEMLVERGRAHFAECADGVLRMAAGLLAKDREDFRSKDLAPPGLAEYIDLVRAVIGQRSTVEEQISLLQRISKFAFRKHPPEHTR